MTNGHHRLQEITNSEATYKMSFYAWEHMFVMPAVSLVAVDVMTGETLSTRDRMALGLLFGTGSSLARHNFGVKEHYKQILMDAASGAVTALVVDQGARIILT